jgi:hypothetical protein
MDRTLMRDTPIVPIACLTLIALLAAVSLLAACGAAMDSGGAGKSGSQKGSPTWVAAWGAPINGTSAPPANATVRNIARVTLGGNRVRVRLSNALSETAPLVIGAASIGIQQDTTSAQVISGTTRVLTFNGATSVTIPPKTDYVYSDPVDLPVTQQQNVAVSLYLPEAAPGAFAANYNSSYLTAAGAGDKTLDETAAAFTATNGSTYALTAVDVYTDQANGAVVGLGSSSFHGTASTRDQYKRVLDLMSVRINNEIPYGEQKGIVSAAFGGDSLHASLPRIERDVWTQTGIVGVMIYNLNDLATRTAAQIIEDYRLVIADAHARGINALCPTWPPAAQSSPGTPTSERDKLNAWILESGECDDVVDWASVQEWEVMPHTYKPQYFADGIHPNDEGHAAMADSAPIRRWFMRGGYEGP